MTQNKTNPELTQAIRLKLSPFHRTSPWPGLGKSMFLASLVATGVYLTFQQDSWPQFICAAIITALIWAPLLVTTHDAIHTTLTGLSWFDSIFPRLVSWPVIWWHGTYAVVHRWHHQMNGTDLEDPERIQPTATEYESAPTWKKFYFRHQWIMNIFVFAGIGLILKTVEASCRMGKGNRSSRQQLVLDGTCIVLFHATAAYFAVQYEALDRYIIWWLISERITGGILQWRAHVLHYGVWHPSGNYVLTQIASCRNLPKSPFLSWYFNRLNFHSVHHAFPGIPFYALSECHGLIKQLVAQSGAPALTEEESYISVTARYIRKSATIPEGSS